MIASLYSETKHTLLGVIAEGVPGLLNSLNALINRVGVSIILQVVVSIPLLRLHPNLFSFGFAYGFIRDQHVREIVEKVNIVYNAQRTLLERSLLYLGGGLLALLMMPTSMITASLYHSAKWGALLYESSYRRLANSNPNSNPSTPRNGLPTPTLTRVGSSIGTSLTLLAESIH